MWGAQLLCYVGMENNRTRLKDNFTFNVNCRKMISF
jgi:hypothetical protein